MKDVKQIFKKDKIARKEDGNFTQTENIFIDDKRLSINARFLLISIMREHDFYKFNLLYHAQKIGMSKWSCQDAVQELIEYGYCFKEKISKRKVNYRWYELPEKNPFYDANDRKSATNNSLTNYQKKMKHQKSATNNSLRLKSASHKAEVSLSIVESQPLIRLKSATNNTLNNTSYNTLYNTTEKFEYDMAIEYEGIENKMSAAYVLNEQQEEKIKEFCANKNLPADQVFELLTDKIKNYGKERCLFALEQTTKYNNIKSIQHLNQLLLPNLT